jgi:hypothetical protein
MLIIPEDNQHSMPCHTFPMSRTACHVIPFPCQEQHAMSYLSHVKSSMPCHTFPMSRAACHVIPFPPPCTYLYLAGPAFTCTHNSSNTHGHACVSGRWLYTSQPYTVNWQSYTCFAVFSCVWRCLHTRTAAQTQPLHLQRDPASPACRLFLFHLVQGSLWCALVC